VGLEFEKPHVNVVVFADATAAEAWFAERDQIRTYDPYPVHGAQDPDCAECEKPAQWEKLHKELREEKIEHRHSLTVSADSRNRLYKDLDQARRTMRKVAKRLRHRANARTWRDDGAVSVSTNELLGLADRLDKPSSADQEAAQSAPTPPELRGNPFDDGEQG
jgi:hypothetical protein